MPAAHVTGPRCRTNLSTLISTVTAHSFLEADLAGIDYQRDELVASSLAEHVPILGRLNVVDAAVGKVGPVQEEVAIPLYEVVDPPFVAALSVANVEEPVPPHGEEGVAPPDHGVPLGRDESEQTGDVAEDIAVDELVTQPPIPRPVLLELPLAAPGLELAIPGAFRRSGVDCLRRGTFPQVVVRGMRRHVPEE